MIEKIEGALSYAHPHDTPAYTLILGAGASHGIVPTAKEMLGIPSPGSASIHENCIPHWLYKQTRNHSPLRTNAQRLKCSKKFWEQFNKKNPDTQIKLNGDLPDVTMIADAYKAVFDTKNIGGLDSSELHQRYLREVTLNQEEGKAHLNATHFYLASLLSLQNRRSQVGPNNKPLYTGERDFARTIFTTNFDPLLQISLQLFQQLYYMTDRPELLSSDALQTDQHKILHLFYAHGSVHRPMANTDNQISLLTKNASALSAYLGSHGVIVMGYSGWDDCLLQALKQTHHFQNNLYWLARSKDSISPSVVDLLSTHSDAYWVPIDDGGKFMAELHLRLCPGAPHTELLQNPIATLLRQIESVSLSGIPDTKSELKTNDGKENYPEKQATVEEIRSMVLERLRHAEKSFLMPSNQEEIIQQAGLSYANNDWDTALKLYEKLLQESDLTPTQRAQYLFRRGFCLSENNKGELALKDYTAVIEMKNDITRYIPEAYYNRGLYYQSKNELDKAIQDYTSTIKTKSASKKIIAMALINRGYCHGIRGKIDKEIEDYTAIINLQGAPLDQLLLALTNRGSCYGDKGMHDESIIDYTTALKTPGAPPEYIARSLINRGVQYGQKGETEKEIEDYSTVIEMTDAPAKYMASAYFNRGICYEDQDRTKEAIKDYQAAIEIPGAPSETITKAKSNIKQLRKNIKSSP